MSRPPGKNPSFGVHLTLPLLKSLQFSHFLAPIAVKIWHRMKPFYELLLLPRDIFVWLRWGSVICVRTRMWTSLVAYLCAQRECTSWCMHLSASTRTSCPPDKVIEWGGSCNKTRTVQNGANAVPSNISLTKWIDYALIFESSDKALSVLQERSKGMLSDKYTFLHLLGRSCLGS